MLVSQFPSQYEIWHNVPRKSIVFCVVFIILLLKPNNIVLKKKKKK